MNFDREVELKKIFQTSPSNFNKGLNKSCLTIHPFCMTWTKVSKRQQLFNEILKSLEPNLANIFRSFTELKENLWYNTMEQCALKI